MADIRIKDLAVTAGSSASDDYLAVDGSTNGTRKLSAYSPTFGGNLSVNGTGLSAISGSLNVAGVGTFNKSLDNITTESDYAIRIKTSADDGGLYLGANSTISAIQAIDPGTTFARNLAIQSQGGNVLIGTTTDGGQKLQVSGGAALTGNLTVSGGSLVVGAGTAVYYFGTPSNNYMYYDGSSLYTRLGGSDRLTISASTGNATFAGSIAIGNTVQTAVAVASTHKVTISIGGTTYYLLATNV